MKILILFPLLLSTAIWASEVAVVKLVRGEAEVVTQGKTSFLKVDDRVSDGAIVKTKEKSFVKLLFVDKSQMNIGPSSEMKIESFSGKDSGVIDLVKGKIRSQVTKDYLQMKDKDKSKLFIKTPNAVMGVRGTDFLITTNGVNTTTVLFEGEIVFNKLSEREGLTSTRLEEIVDRGVRLYPREFSVMEANRPLPTVPSLLNIEQKENLEKNEDFESDRSPGSARQGPPKSVVPDGLNGQIVGNDSETLKNEVSQATAETNPPSSRDPDGYVKGDMVKPANGSFVHVDSGVIIPPGPNSVLDKNTNTYIPGQESGNVGKDGSYLPPKNIEITPDGKILATVPDQRGEMVVKELPPPAPVVTAASPFGNTVARIGAFEHAPLPAGTKPPLGDVPLPQPGTDPRFSPTGGFFGPNDPTRVLGTGGLDTTIRVKPTE